MTRVKSFLERCDEVDASIFTGDIFLEMNYTERAEFADFLTSWFTHFVGIREYTPEKGKQMEEIEDTDPFEQKRIEFLKDSSSCSTQEYIKELQNEIKKLSSMNARLELVWRSWKSCSNCEHEGRALSDLPCRVCDSYSSWKFNEKIILEAKEDETCLTIPKGLPK
jgi:hypothetical protein